MLRSAQVLDHGGLPHPGAGGDLALAEAFGGQTQHFGRSFSSVSSFWVLRSSWSNSFCKPSSPRRPGARLGGWSKALPPRPVSRFVRWSESPGSGGRFAPESVVVFAGIGGRFELSPCAGRTGLSV